MAGIDAAFHRLQPVALLQALRHEAVARRHHGELPLRQRRLLLGRAHVGPQHAAALDQRIGLQLDLLAVAALGRLRRHLDALAGVVVLPAVIGAAQPVVLVAAEPQRDAAVGAELVGQRIAALACRARPAAARRAASTRTGGHSFSGSSSASSAGCQLQPEHLAHRRAGAGLGEQIVLFFSQHRDAPGSFAADSASGGITQAFSGC